jgi:ABC-type uncharacterized transport system permease subunit
MFAKIASGIAITALASGLALTHGTSNANASGTRLQTVTQTETIVSTKCYKTHKVTTTYYHWSLTHYVLYPSPKVTVTDSETCHK